MRGMLYQAAEKEDMQIVPDILGNQVFKINHNGG